MGEQVFLLTASTVENILLLRSRQSVGGGRFPDMEDIACKSLEVS